VNTHECHLRPKFPRYEKHVETRVQGAVVDDAQRKRQLISNYLQFDNKRGGNSGS
jgi:hypothetical protein